MAELVLQEWRVRGVAPDLRRGRGRSQRRNGGKRRPVIVVPGPRQLCLLSKPSTKTSAHPLPRVDKLPDPPPCECVCCVCALLCVCVCVSIRVSVTLAFFCCCRPGWLQRRHLHVGARLPAAPGARPLAQLQPRRAQPQPCAAMAPPRLVHPPVSAWHGLCVQNRAPCVLHVAPLRLPECWFMVSGTQRLNCSMRGPCVLWCRVLWNQFIASVKKTPPYDSEYPGYLRLSSLIQTGTQSSTP